MEGANIRLDLFIANFFHLVEPQKENPFTIHSFDFLYTTHIIVCQPREFSIIMMMTFNNREKTSYVGSTVNHNFQSFSPSHGFKSFPSILNGKYVSDNWFKIEEGEEINS